MTPLLETEFVFALTNPGSEQALKLEIDHLALGWRLSYQRRGFVTFKTDGKFSLNSLDQPLACARRLCLSLGKCATREEAMALIEPGILIQQARFHERKMQGVPGAEAMPVPGQLVGNGRRAKRGRVLGGAAPAWAVSEPRSRQVTRPRRCRFIRHLARG
jgi:hypothetical protein